MDNVSAIAIAGIISGFGVVVAVSHLEHVAAGGNTVAPRLSWQRRPGGAAHQRRDDSQSGDLPCRGGESRGSAVPARQPLTWSNARPIVPIPKDSISNSRLPAIVRPARFATQISVDREQSIHTAGRAVRI